MYVETCTLVPGVRVSGSGAFEMESDGVGEVVSVVPPGGERLHAKRQGCRISLSATGRQTEKAAVCTLGRRRSAVPAFELTVSRAVRKHVCC